MHIFSSKSKAKSYRRLFPRSRHRNFTTMLLRVLYDCYCRNFISRHAEKYGARRETSVARTSQDIACYSTRTVILVSNEISLIMKSEYEIEEESGSTRLVKISLTFKAGRILRRSRRSKITSITSSSSSWWRRDEFRRPHSEQKRMTPHSAKFSAEIIHHLATLWSSYENLSMRNNTNDTKNTSAIARQGKRPSFDIFTFIRSWVISFRSFDIPKFRDRH